nr:MAG TPA: hypothetical protein [Caudoviricetes sp.]
MRIQSETIQTYINRHQKMMGTRLLCVVQIHTC